MVVHLSGEFERLVQDKVERDQGLDTRATAFKAEIGRRLDSGPATQLDFSAVKRSIREEVKASKANRR